MTSWLFTNKPSEYRLVDALAGGIEEIEWLATRYIDEMQIGDRVYLWQLKDNAPLQWGLHAIGELISRPRNVRDIDLDNYWTSDSGKRLNVARVRIRILAVAGVGRHIRKEVVETGPDLADLEVLRFSQAANFKLPERHERALLNLWTSVTGIDPFAVAPTTTTLDGETRFDEMARVQLSIETGLLFHNSLDEIEALLKRRRTGDQRGLPRRIKVAGTLRDPLVVAYARLRASHKCEIGDCSHATFEGLDGLPYVEVHHIQPLGTGGADTISNTACLCATHHREVHLGRRRHFLESELKAKRG